MPNVPGGESPLTVDVAKVLAIDIHTHAEVSCHDHEDPIMGKFFDAASVYFKADRKRPTIPETIAYYRAQNIAFRDEVMPDILKGNAAGVLGLA